MYVQFGGILVKLAKVEHFRDEVIGLKPVYSEVGNITEILLKNGDAVQDRRVMRSVVKALAASYAIDLIAQRKMLKGKLGRKGLLPFYLGTERVFIPLKMRSAVAENDAVYGYVDMAHVKDSHYGGDKGCLIKLSNGIEINVLSNHSTVLEAQHTGMLVLGILKPDGSGANPLDQVREAARILGNTITSIASQLDRIEQNLK